MPLLRDRLIADLRRRSRPACITCLSRALNADYEDALQLSLEETALIAFGRSFGPCPECHVVGVLLHPPPY